MSLKYVNLFINNYLNIFLKLIFVLSLKNSNKSNYKGAPYNIFKDIYLIIFYFAISIQSFTFFTAI